MYTPGWVPSALSRRSALWGGLAAAGALAAGCSNTPVAGPAPPPTGVALPVTDTDARPHRCPRRRARRGSWSSGTAAPPGTGPSTRSRPTSSRSGWGPTPSTSTSSPPATGRSSRATSPRSAGPPTSPSAPSSPRAAPPSRSTAPTYTGWFTTDFTLAEIRTLRAKERIPQTRPHNTLYDGRFPVVTFDEVLDLLDRLADELRRPVGVLPEVKHSTYFASLGLPVEPGLVETLRRRGRDGADSGVIIQSFETANLRALRTQVACPLLQLVDAAGTRPADLVAAGDPRTSEALVTPQGLREVAGYAAWLGPTKELIIPLGPDDAAGAPTTLVRDAHAANLRVMPYTFRNENEFLPAGRRRGGPETSHPRTPTATRSASTSSTSRWASTPCSATTRIQRWQRSRLPDSAPADRARGATKERQVLHALARLTARGAGRCSTSATSRSARASA